MKETFTNSIPASYNKYIKRKILIIFLVILVTILLAMYAINAGSAGISTYDVIKTLIGKGSERFKIIVWNIRMPRVLSAIVAGTGLSVAGCVTQSILRNPLASPFTLGISQGASFGAALAIIVFGAGTTSNPDSVIINNSYLVVIFAFLGSMGATLIIMMLAKNFKVTPEAMVLAGVALGSLFSAITMILQYFSDDVQVASVVFWTFGDIGRTSWSDLAIMSTVVGLSLIYFMLNRWNYNALDSGEETAKGLGVDVERIRLIGMFIASLIAATITSFVGIIGFIGLVGPHIMRRLIGSDHRFLIPASSAIGSLILLASDTLGRTIISPIVLPVGAITSFLGAPVFLYVLSRGYKK